MLEFLLVLLFGGSKYESKVTFIRAIFLVTVIAVIIVVLISVAAFGGFQEFINTIKELIKNFFDTLNAAKDNIVII